MRIAIITTGFAQDENDFGGAAVFYNFVKELSQRNGIELTVFALYYPDGKPEYKFFDAKVFSFTGGSESRFHKPGIWRRCKRKFAEKHHTKKFDMIHSLWCGESGYVASQLSEQFNIPMIATVCGGELAAIKQIRYGSQLKFWQSYFVRKTFNQAKAIIAGSDYIIDKIMVYEGEKYIKKSKKIPFGVGESFIPERKRRVSLIESGFSIINISNVVPVKSHIDLLKAFKIVLQKYPNTQLTCCGDDSKGILKNIVNEFKLEKNVVINGFADYSQIPALLNDSDIFVLSSLYESQNMSIIEAAFCGLPVVSTNVGIAPEISPYISEAGDYEQLAKKILYVISDYDRIKAEAILKAAGFHQKYSVATCVDEYIKLYSEILSSE